MTTSAPALPAPLTVRFGSSGRIYVLAGNKVVYTARSLAEANEVLYGPDGAEGPTCTICDGLGHGYPGAGPCPLEERGGYDIEDVEREMMVMEMEADRAQSRRESAAIWS